MIRRPADEPLESLCVDPFAQAEKAYLRFLNLNDGDHSEVLGPGVYIGFGAGFPFYVDPEQWPHFAETMGGNWIRAIHDDELTAKQARYVAVIEARHRKHIDPSYQRVVPYVAFDPFSDTAARVSDKVQFLIEEVTR